ncbi:MAG: MATE family efflux transporter [Anaerovoracaceae bacterium]
MSFHKENPFLQGPILPVLMKFAMPILLALFLQAMYGAVDLWAVGKFCGPADVSAVATGSQTMLIITGIIVGLSMGTTILLAQKFGQKDEEGAADAIGASLWIFSIISVVLSVVMLIGAPYIAVIMHAPAEALEKTVHYITICSSGIIFISAYNVISGIFRGLGNSKSPLLFVAIACVTNIIGDVLFVAVLGMDASGTAFATVIAQAVSVVLSLVIIVKKGFPFPVAKENFAIKKNVIKKILKLGSPIALQDMCNEVSFLVIIAIVNTLGLTASAGVGIAERLVMFMLLVPITYMSSISSFVAQNVGSDQYSRARKSMWLGMSTAVCFGVAMFYFSFFHGDVLSSIFTKDPDVIAASASFLKATAIESITLTIAYCFIGYFNGIGKTTFVMLQGLGSIFLVRIPYAYFASIQENPSMFSIGLSAVASAGFILIASLIYYKFGKKH